MFDELLKLDLAPDLRKAIGELLEIIRQKEIADTMEDDHNKDWSALNLLFREVSQLMK